jgi:hypothetical protein
MFNIFGFVKNKKAQIVLPAVLLIPTILLVIYLLFETTKVSKEKIRHQFALDTSSFVEMTSLSNYLNATAYVNGAFPFRIFRDIFEANKAQIEVDPYADNADSLKPISYYDLYYQAGAFPSMSDYNSSPKATDTKWDLHYYQDTRKDWEKDVPKLDSDTFYPLMSEEIVKTHQAFLNDDLLVYYFLVYLYLGNIYEDQKKVYERVVKDNEFFRKGYFYNTGNCSLSECGREGAQILKNYFVKTEPFYVSKFRLFFKHDDGTSQKVDMDMENFNGHKINNGKLFQIAYLSKGSKEKLRTLYKGVDITQRFTLSNNYFNVNLMRYNPRVHTRVALQCTNESNNCIWPAPTSKYQVRLYP